MRFRNERENFNTKGSFNKNAEKKFYKGSESWHVHNVINKTFIRESSDDILDETL